MYQYQGTTPDGLTQVINSGTLPEMLTLGRRYFKRLGMIGTIVRPDGTSMRETPRMVPCPEIKEPITFSVVDEFEFLIPSTFVI